MTPTKIETFDYCYNPMKGCLHDCPYCYARTMAKRFNKGDFSYKFYPEKLKEPEKFTKTGKAIFVGSTTDVFGDWVPSEDIQKVIDSVENDPVNNYFFLTKNPKRYNEFAFPDNCYLGFSASTQKDFNERAYIYPRVNFISLEPLQEHINITFLTDYENFKWVIVGQETGNRKGKIKIHNRWILDIICQCKRTNTRLWIKDNVNYTEIQAKQHIIEGWSKK